MNTMDEELEELVYVGRSPIHANGLFARVDIEPETWIGTYEGPVTDEDGTYVLWVGEDDEQYGVDGQNLLRFMNHSATPNAEFDGQELFAIEHIPAGTEITFDYGEDWEDVD